MSLHPENKIVNISLPIKIQYEPTHYIVEVKEPGKLLKKVCKESPTLTVYQGRVIKNLIERKAFNILRTVFYKIIDALIRFFLNRKDSNHERYYAYMQRRASKAQLKMAELANTRDMQAEFNDKTKELETAIQNRDTLPQEREILKNHLRIRRESNEPYETFKNEEKAKSDLLLTRMKDYVKWRSQTTLLEELNRIDPNSQEAHRIQELCEFYSPDLLSILSREKDIRVAAQQVKTKLIENIQREQAKKLAVDEKHQSFLRNTLLERLRHVDLSVDALSTTTNIPHAKTGVNCLKIVDDVRKKEDIKLAIEREFNENGIIRANPIAPPPPTPVASTPDIKQVLNVPKPTAPPSPVKSADPTPKLSTIQTLPEENASNENQAPVINSLESQENVQGQISPQPPELTPIEVPNIVAIEPKQQLPVENPQPLVMTVIAPILPPAPPLLTLTEPQKRQLKNILKSMTEENLNTVLNYVRIKTETSIDEKIKALEDFKNLFKNEILNFKKKPESKQEENKKFILQNNAFDDLILMCSKPLENYKIEIENHNLVNLKKELDKLDHYLIFMVALINKKEKYFFIEDYILVEKERKELGNLTNAIIQKNAVVIGKIEEKEPKKKLGIPPKISPPVKKI